MTDIKEALEKELAGTTAKLEKLEALKERANPDQLEALDGKRRELKARRQRLAVCADILAGKAFTISEIGGKMSVVVPSPETARVVREAEKKMGAEVSGYRQGEMAVGAAAEDQCPTCGSFGKWREKDGRRICSWCHPEPKKESK